MDSLEAFMLEKPSGHLYHYTTAVGLIGIVQTRKLRATDYRHLNDRQEYKLGARLLQRELQAHKLNSAHKKLFDKILEKILSGCFVASFSEKRDQLSQWRAYCPGGNGYSLGFDINNPIFDSAAEHRFNLVRCQYDTSNQRKLCQHVVQTFMDGLITKKRWLKGEDLASQIKSLFERYNWGLAIALIIAATKHPGFREEREWRLVSQDPDEAQCGMSFRPGRFGVTPFYELPTETKDKPSRIDEITIGPTSNQQSARAALRLLSSKCKMQFGSIKSSKTPLRN